MAKPLVSDVLSLARSILADDEVSGGELYTDTKLLPFLKSFYRTIYRELALTGNPLVFAEAFYDLPANTIQLDPAAASITDMGELQWIAERKPTGAAIAVTGATVTANVITLTATAHGRTAGQIVVAWGVGGITGASGIWSVAVPTVNTLTLNGSYGSGTFTSGGFVSYSVEDFSKPLERVDRIDDTPQTPQSAQLSKFAWMGDVIRFLPSNEIRQLRINYSRSGNAPTQTTDTIGIDDIHELLAYGTCAAASETRAPNLSASYMARAVGPRYVDNNEPGGHLFQHLQSGVHAAQGSRWNSPPYNAPNFH